MTGKLGWPRLSLTLAVAIAAAHPSLLRANQTDAITSPNGTRHRTRNRPLLQEQRRKKTESPVAHANGRNRGR